MQKNLGVWKKKSEVWNLASLIVPLTFKHTGLYKLQSQVAHNPREVNPLWKCQVHNCYVLPRYSLIHSGEKDQGNWVPMFVSLLGLDGFRKVVIWVEHGVWLYGHQHFFFSKEFYPPVYLFVIFYCIPLLSFHYCRSVYSVTRQRERRAGVGA